MITRGSCVGGELDRLVELASGSVTLVMPTLEPSRDGFTHSGVPIAAACSRQPSSPTSQNSTCGTPWKASSRLKVSLSMHTAAASTPGPT